MKLIFVLVIIAILIALAYVYRDKISNILPGWKHALVGGLTTVGSGVLAIAQYLQTLDFSPILKDHPEYMLYVTGGLGLLVLMLSWVTPRAKA